MRLDSSKPARVASVLVLPILALALLTSSVPAAAQRQSDRITYPRDRRPVIRLPDGSSRQIDSLLRIDGAMRYGSFVWRDVAVPGAIWVRVDLAHQLISVFRGSHEIGTALVLFGTDGKPTPTGMFPVLSKTRLHVSRRYEAEMPFSLWLTRDGVAIHASRVRYGVATHGCIGVPPAFAEQLFKVIGPKDLVVILPDRRG